MNYSIPPISNLFLEAFGLTIGGVYKPEVSSGNPNDTSHLFQGIRSVKIIEESKEISGCGTPIIYPLYFGEDSYKKYNNKGEIIIVNMGEFRLPIASVVSFRRDKIMGVTRLNGGISTVKEIYGFDDWQVTINGFLIPDGSQPQGLTTPLEQEKELLKWDSLASSVKVFSELFTLYGIKNLTIKGINVEPIRGKPRIRAFTINALSDDAIELNIKSQV
jgi:hypothetical protein